MLPDLRPSFYYTALVSIDMLSNPYDASPGPRDGTCIVWDGPVPAHLRPSFCNTDPCRFVVVTLYDASPGSRDGTCIVWDLFRLTYVRQLRGHSAPVAAVAINDVTVSGG